MSRRRPKPALLFVYVDLVCATCGGNLTRAAQHRGQHPRAGQNLLDQRGAAFEEAPDGSRKVVATCSRCGAKPQVRWERITAQLDALDENGDYRASYAM